MNKILAITALGILFAVPAFASTEPVGVPNVNGCGLGSFPLVRWGYQQDRHQPPLFIHFDFDHDDDGLVREGRSDTGPLQMMKHDACVLDKQS